MTLYCENCRKEIVVVGVGHGAASAEDIESIRRSIEKEGKLVLFNPPPFAPYFCPVCHTELSSLEETDR